MEADVMVLTALVSFMLNLKTSKTSTEMTIDVKKAAENKVALRGMVYIGFFLVLLGRILAPDIHTITTVKTFKRMVNEGATTAPQAYARAAVQSSGGLGPS